MSSPRLAAPTTLAMLVASGIVACTLHPGEEWNRTDGVAIGGAGNLGGGSSSTRSTVEDATDQSSERMCPVTSTLLAGRRAAGDVCSTPADCASVCCDCGTGSQSWLSASCVGGRCVDSLTSCNRTNATYCGGGGSIIVGGGTGSADRCGNGPATTSCDTCIDASCCSESLACHASADCVTLESCDVSCGTDAECRSACYAASGTGAFLLQQLDTCVATACGAACEP